MSKKDPCEEAGRPGEATYEKCREALAASIEASIEADSPIIADKKNAKELLEIEAEIEETAAAAAAANSEQGASEIAEEEAVAAVLQKEKEIERQEEVSTTLASKLDKEQAKLTEMKNTGASEAKIAGQQIAVTSTTIAVTNSFAAGAKLKAEAQTLADNLKSAEAKTAAATSAAVKANAAATDASSKTILLSTYDAGDLEGSSGRKRLLAQQQCFLLYNNHFFPKKHKELLDGSARVFADTATSTGGPEDRPVYNFHSNPKYKPKDPGTRSAVQTSPGYWSETTNSTKVILVNDIDQSNDSTIINRMKVKKNQGEFDKITPAEYAQLLPTLRFFKIVYNEDEEFQSSIEIKFGNKINVEQIGAVNQTFKGSIKGDGGGVKSFEWSYLGTDAFTATRDLKATLKLNFQSFHELQKDRFATLPDGTRIKYKYLDMIIQAHCGDRETDQNNRPIYDPGCYEIMAEVGYAEPTVNINLTPEMRESIRSSIESLYLVMTDHAFEFEQDGTFSLTINYRARLGSQMGSRKFNVLLPGGGNEGTQPQKKIESLKKELAELKEAEREDADDSADPAADSDDKSPAQEKQEELDEYVEKQSMRFYNAMYSSLRNRKWIHGTRIPKADEAKYLNYDQKIKDPKTGTATDFFVGLPDPLPNDHPIFYDAVSDDDSWFWSNDWNEMYDTSGLGPHGEVGVTSDDPGGGVDEQVEGQRENQLERLKAQYESDEEERIRFVYFGDIIAVARDWIMAEDEYAYADADSDFWYGPASDPYASTTDPANDASPSEQLKRVRKSFHIILGNVLLKDFSENGKTRLVNMANIPVSLDAFLNFMTKNVVAKKRKVYLFSAFINDLLRELVMDNLSRKCFGGLVAGSVRAQVSMLEIPSESGKEPIADQGKTRMWYRQTLAGSDSAEYSVFHSENIGTGDPPLFLNAVPPAATTGQTKSSFDYLLINSMSTKPKLYGVWDRGDWIAKHPGDSLLDDLDDKTRGIPHYTFGQNAGILKTVKFQKTDQEYLPEAKYEQEGSSAINQLAAVYDVTFEMLGTARFQPGQYIYFDPITMGVGHPWQTENGPNERSYANLMGLGGYHLVVEVASNIQRGEFVTTLKTRWTTSGCHPIRGCPK